MFYPEEGEQ